jgi:hypothetical protein
MEETHDKCIELARSKEARSIFISKNGGREGEGIKVWDKMCKKIKIR